MMIRLAVHEDLPILREIYLAGMRGLHARGVPQWTQEYPVSHLLLDIDRGELFVLEADRSVAGAMALNRRMDEWLEPIQFTPADSFYVHRLVVRPAGQGRGFAKYMMNWAARYAVLHGGTAMRLDTNSLNQQAIGLYHRLGYVKKGTFADFDSEYTVFELLFK